MGNNLKELNKVAGFLMSPEKSAIFPAFTFCELDPVMIGMSYLIICISF